jgi:antitoxin MazE
LPAADYILYIHEKGGVCVESRVRKWGNSLGIRVPQAIAKDVGLSQDCLISLEVQAGQLIVRPKPEKYTLEELLARVTPDNIHPQEETDWGKPVGKEIW